ncbi:unnamed protein product [Prunus armeniaca]|uniref:Uncharacterized protein n=1 Tax=Prunus armeniaca TaxID=36596 RepID=A0A6J5XU97_PRUAR|nr:unnamed protein product [Prunus armeniaca]
MPIKAIPSVAQPEGRRGPKAVLCLPMDQACPGKLCLPRNRASPRAIDFMADASTWIQKIF